MEAYLTAKEAAEYLKLAERTLVRLAHEGKIPGVKIGGQWRFRRALLDEYLDTLASESVSTSGAAPRPGRSTRRWRRSSPSTRSSRSSRREPA